MAADVVAPPHSLVLGQVGHRSVLEGVLLEGIERNAVFAGKGAIHEFDDDFLSQIYPVQVTVSPGDEGMGAGLSSPFPVGPVVGASPVVGLDLVRWTVHDVHAPAIGLPAHLARGETLIGVGDAPVVLVPELVDHGVRIGIPSQPELLDELVALLVVGQTVEGVSLIGSNNVGDVLLEPFLEEPVLSFPAQRPLPLPVLLLLSLHNRQR